MKLDTDAVGTGDKIADRCVFRVAEPGDLNHLRYRQVGAGGPLNLGACQIHRGVGVDLTESPAVGEVHASTDLVCGLVVGETDERRRYGAAWVGGDCGDDAVMGSDGLDTRIAVDVSVITGCKTGDFVQASLIECRYPLNPRIPNRKSGVVRVAGVVASGVVRRRVCLRPDQDRCGEEDHFHAVDRGNWM